MDEESLHLHTDTDTDSDSDTLPYVISALTIKVSEHSQTQQQSKHQTASALKSFQQRNISSQTAATWLINLWVFRGKCP